MRFKNTLYSGSWLALAVVACQTSSLPAYGQAVQAVPEQPEEMIEPSGSSIMDDRLAEAGEDIVVTAQKRSESVQKVPINITAVGGSRLATLDVRSVQDLSAYVPSFRVTNPGSSAVSTITLRGVGQRDRNVQNEGAVAEFIDGAYVSFSPAIAQPIFDVERIEVLKGPQGTLFGRNATGGLVSIISKRPTDTFDAQLMAQYGSYNEVKVEGAVGGPIAQDISARASFSYMRHDGFTKDTDGGPNLGPNDSLSGRIQLLFKPTSDFSYLVSARGWRQFKVHGISAASVPFVKDANGLRSPSSYADYAAFCSTVTRGLPTPIGAELGGNCFAAERDPFHTGNNEESYYEQNYYGFTGTGELNLGESVTLTSITDYQHLDNDFHSDTDGTAQPYFYFDWNVKGSNQFSQELRLNGTVDTLKWVAGLYYLNIKHNITNRTDLYGHPGFGVLLVADYRQKTDSAAAFTQLDWEFLPKLTLSVGGRILHDKKTIVNNSTCTANPSARPGLCTILGTAVYPRALAFNRSYQGKIDKWNWSARAVVQYQPSSLMMVYGGVTRGTKGGGFNSGAAQFYPLSEIIYKPETLINYEVGIKASTPDRLFSIDTSAFYYDYRNYQTFSINSIGGLQTLNVDARVLGLEMSATLRPVEGLSLTALGTYLDTKQKNLPIGGGLTADFQMPEAPKWNLGGEIRYGVPIQGDDELLAQLNGVYVGKRSISAIDYADQRYPSYVRLDARVAYTLPGKHWTFAAFVNNFTDETIDQARLDFTTIIGGAMRVVDRPRWFGASVSWKY